MKIVNGRIAEATRDEMYDLYLKMEWYRVMSFPEWLSRFEELGTKVTDEEEDVQ